MCQAGHGGTAIEKKPRWLGQTDMQNMTVQRGRPALGCLLQAASHSLVNTRGKTLPDYILIRVNFGRHVQGRLLSVYYFVRA